MTDVDNGNAVKRCSLCKQVKPLDRFSPYRRNRDKHASRCKACQVQLALKWQAQNPEKAAARKRAWREKNRELLQERGRARNLAVKTEVISAYGGFCACCGEAEIAFLAIDHINGDGADHRRSGEVAHGRSFYEWLRANDYPAGFQVLCFNCNFAKSQYGGCPHKRGMQACANS